MFFKEGRSNKSMEGMPMHVHSKIGDLVREMHITETRRLFSGVLRSIRLMGVSQLEDVETWNTPAPMDMSGMGWSRRVSESLSNVRHPYPCQWSTDPLLGR